MSRRYWYAYIGTSDPTNPWNYIRVQANPDTFCFGGTIVCAVYGFPNWIDSNRILNLSDSLQNYITIATSLATMYPLPPQKPYVYTKQLI